MVRNLASSFVLRRHVSVPGYSVLFDCGIRGTRGRHVFFCVNFVLVVVVVIVVFVISIVVTAAVAVFVLVIVMSVAGEAALSRDARTLPVDR